MSAIAASFAPYRTLSSTSRVVDFATAWQAAGFPDMETARQAAAHAGLLGLTEEDAHGLTLAGFKQLCMLSPGSAGEHARAYFATMEEFAYHAACAAAGAGSSSKAPPPRDGGTVGSVLMHLMTETDVLKSRISALSAQLATGLGSGSATAPVSPPATDDVIISFVSECIGCTGTNSHVLQMKTAYEAYWAFCLANGHEPRQRKDFKAEMVVLLGKYIPQNGRLCNFWRGVRLIPDMGSPPSDD